MSVRHSVSSTQLFSKTRICPQGGGLGQTQRKSQTPDSGVRGLRAADGRGGRRSGSEVSPREAFVVVTAPLPRSQDPETAEALSCFIRRKPLHLQPGPSGRGRVRPDQDSQVVTSVPRRPVCSRLWPVAWRARLSPVPQLLFLLSQQPRGQASSGHLLWVGLGVRCLHQAVRSWAGARVTRMQIKTNGCAQTRGVPKTWMHSFGYSKASVY